MSNGLRIFQDTLSEQDWFLRRQGHGWNASENVSSAQGCQVGDLDLATLLLRRISPSLVAGISEALSDRDKESGRE